MARVKNRDNQGKLNVELDIYSSNVFRDSDPWFYSRA